MTQVSIERRYKYKAYKVKSVRKKKRSERRNPGLGMGNGDPSEAAWGETRLLGVTAKPEFPAARGMLARSLDCSLARSTLEEDEEEMWGKGGESHSGWRTPSLFTSSHTIKPRLKTTNDCCYHDGAVTADLRLERRRLNGEIPSGNSSFSRSAWIPRRARTRRRPAGAFLSVGTKRLWRAGRGPLAIANERNAPAPVLLGLPRGMALLLER